MPRASKSLRQSLASWLISALVHATLLIVLAMIVVQAANKLDYARLVASAANDDPDLDAPLEAQAGLPTERPEHLTEAPGHELSLPRVNVVDPTEPPPAAMPLVLGGDMPPASAMVLGLVGGAGGGIGDRSPSGRAKGAGGGGATPDSEKAVDRGLRWLAAHQNADGGWRFNHQSGVCQGLCRNPGTAATTTGATALALLPFLGAGHTHLSGEHQEVVRGGLYYLQGRMLATPNGGDLQEGTMYAQGLAALALCEAFAMSHDEGLRPYAQQALNFIVFAQDQQGGGWRYSPGQPGDATVTGWQLMALKSGRLAGLSVPTLAGANGDRFLTSIQSKGGAAYGYREPGKELTTSAVGLLCRMLGGWGKQHPALGRGVGDLDKAGPSRENMYYNYYATQVMWHWGGYEWERWNAVMRDYLVTSQATQGHESGSWHFPEKHGDAGGRLYNTAMSVMTLEIYYRYLPLYRTENLDDY